jgi:hypothetical protein
VGAGAAKVLGVPITYVAAQLGYRDPSIPLRVYTVTGCPTSRAPLVYRLDESTALHSPQAAPRAFDDPDQKTLSAVELVVSRKRLEPHRRIPANRCPLFIDRAGRPLGVD